MKRYLKDTITLMADFVIDIRGFDYTLDVYDLTGEAEMSHLLTIWQEGMELDEGPLMTFDDYEHFLEFLTEKINEEIESR